MITNKPAEAIETNDPAVEGKAGEVVAEAMVDALEDILRWERASERALRVAPLAPPADVSG